MRTPSIKGMSEEDIDDAADLIADAASGVDLKDCKPEGMQTLKAKLWVSKFLHALSVEVQNKYKPKEAR